MRICEAQELIRETYIGKDSSRGLDRTFTWFVEEVGELAEAIRRRDYARIREEVADVLAWLLSIANLVPGLNVEEAFVERYGRGCPKCSRKPCACGV